MGLGFDKVSITLTVLDQARIDHSFAATTPQAIAARSPVVFDRPLWFLLVDDPLTRDDPNWRRREG